MLPPEAARSSSFTPGIPPRSTTSIPSRPDLVSIVEGFPDDKLAKGASLGRIGKTKYLERMLAVADLVPPRAKR
jgi:hypothetical protein